jgi:hypothetical protein
MKQLTSKQAIAFHDSKVWESWTDEQIAGFQLFQKYLAVPFDRFHQAMEKVLGRLIFTHEFGSAGNLEKEFLGLKKAPTFEEILNLIPKDKQIIIGI